jgi:hypothetical protein
VHDAERAQELPGQALENAEARLPNTGFSAHPCIPLYSLGFIRERFSPAIHWNVVFFAAGSCVN